MFQHHHRFVAFLYVIILHTTRRVESAVGPLSAHIHVTARKPFRLQDEMHKYIFGRCGIVLIILTADYGHTILVFIVTVVASGHLRKQGGVIIRFKPFHFVYTHRRTVHIQNLKLVKFVSSGEYQVLTMCEGYSFVVSDIGFRIHHSVVPSSVLHHHRVQLLVRVHNRQRTIVEIQRHLLMLLVKVYVCVAAHFRLYTDRFFKHTETRFQYWFILTPAIFVNQHFIVSTQQKARFRIGKSDLIMCVYLRGIETLFIVFHGLVVQSAQIVAFKDAVRGCPIILAVLDVIDIAVIVMTHLIP